ncbi:MAG TPA: XRE family transcriptional regulator [Nautiliaceae bacterium]|nr:XRE family transcriptional regulator [Nautiliaceae bacterium]
MTIKEFHTRLKELKISKKKFSELSNIPYNTIKNWNGDTKPIPKWVKSWLDYYEKSKALDEIFQVCKKIKIKD